MSNTYCQCRENISLLWRHNQLCNNLWKWTGFFIFVIFMHFCAFSSKRSFRFDFLWSFSIMRKSTLDHWSSPLTMRRKSFNLLNKEIKTPYFVVNLLTIHISTVCTWNTWCCWVIVCKQNCWVGVAKIIIQTVSVLNLNMKKLKY